MRKPKSKATQFEDALADLVEMHMRDGLSAADVKSVLQTRAEDDYEELAFALGLNERK